jgi:hypothetical protein
MVSARKPVVLSADVTLMLAILDQENECPGVDDVFYLRNLGGEPPVGSLYIDSNPGEMNKAVQFIYEQSESAELLRGAPPHATYEAMFKAIRIPMPRSFREIIDKMKEGQFLKLGPTDKGVFLVPRSRRRPVLEFLGFKVK